MPTGRIGSSLLRRVVALEDNAAHGYMRVIVTGTSIGFGGTEPPVYVPTTFKVKHAVANLAKEYDLRDATQIYNYGDDVFAGEMKCNVDDTLTVGFYVEYKQLDPNEPWELCFNWFARG